MKTKSRSSDITLPGGSITSIWVDPRIAPGTPAGNKLAVARYWGPGSNSEVINYELPPFKGNGACSHIKSSLRIFDTARVATVSIDTYLLNIDRSPWYIPCFYSTEINKVPTVDLVMNQARWDAFSSDAMEAMLPTFSEGGESLVNFVLELGEVKSLFTTWLPRLRKVQKAIRRRQLINTLKQEGKWVEPKRVRPKKPIPVKATAKELAGYHLNVSFGWLPFISDVQRIYGALDNFRKKVRKLQESANKPIRKHYSRTIDIATLPPDVTLLTDSDGTWDRKVLWVIKPKYHATLDFIYALPDMSDPTNQAKAFMDSLGVQGNPSIIWNAIPFSFVADWFVDVGGWLNRLRADNLRIPATVTGFCHSIKMKWECSYTFTPKSTGRLFFPEVGIPILVATREGLQYERRRDIPSYGTFNTTVRAPSWNQVALATSLTVSRL